MFLVSDLESVTPCGQELFYAGQNGYGNRALWTGEKDRAKQYDTAEEALEVANDIEMEREIAGYEMASYVVVIDDESGEIIWE